MIVGVRVVVELKGDWLWPYQGQYAAYKVCIFFFLNKYNENFIDTNDVGKAHVHKKYTKEHLYTF